MLRPLQAASLGNDVVLVYDHAMMIQYDDSIYDENIIEPKRSETKTFLYFSGWYPVGFSVT